MGNTQSGTPGRRLLAVHPHVCGEHPHDPYPTLTKDGSSPRVWGTRCSWVSAPIPIRFIPTCVGNTTSGKSKSPRDPVHPQVCGEHNVVRILFNPAYGSSPRVWGTPRVGHVPPDRHRFIPTCVGNTRPPRCGVRHSPVHPHVCGEHSLALRKAACQFGSSPRVWGTLQQLDLHRVRDRFIPTCVGNTLQSADPVKRQSVHPHVCGEHTPRKRRSISSTGSSPRLWGTRPGSRGNG